MNGLRPPSVFVDTGAWVAIQFESDQNYLQAIETWNRFLAEQRTLVTSNAVVGETYTYLRTSRRGGYVRAWRFLDWLERARSVQRHPIAGEVETEAYRILRQYRDHAFSYVDATSFAFMRSAGIMEAFAFDNHFATAGFTRIPLDRTADG